MLVYFVLSQCPFFREALISEFYVTSHFFRFYSGGMCHCVLLSVNSDVSEKYDDGDNMRLRSVII
jgi:hypothetical protein